METKYETCPNCEAERLELIGNLDGDDLWNCLQCGHPHRGPLSTSEEKSSPAAPEEDIYFPYGEYCS